MTGLPTAVGKDRRVLSMVAAVSVQRSSIDWRWLFVFGLKNVTPDKAFFPGDFMFGFVSRDVTVR